MSKYTSETIEWMNKFKEREKPYGMSLNHGLTLISVVQDEQQCIKNLIGNKGYVKWRIINESPRKRKISIISKCTENRINWDTNDLRVNNENLVSAWMEVRGTFDEEEKYYFKDSSILFSAIKSGCETICTNINNHGPSAESQFNIDIGLYKKTESIGKSLDNVQTIYTKEIKMGDTIEIKAGDIINEKGQVLFGKFNEVITNLDSTGQIEFAEALKNLKEVLMASPDITEEKKKEHIEIIKQIGEEATKKKPNKTLLRMMGDGLLSTLKAIPDVAKAVSAILPFIEHP